jgi:hypothetical protein
MHISILDELPVTSARLLQFHMQFHDKEYRINGACFPDE